MGNIVAGITDDDMQKLYEDFETTQLFKSIDFIEEMRGHFEQGDHGEPPEIREDFFKLHELAMAVCNSGRKDKVLEMYELASDVQDQINDMLEKLRAVQSTVSKLIDACPDDLYD